MWDMNTKKDDHLPERKEPSMKDKPIEVEFQIDDDGNLKANHGQLFGTDKKDYRPGQLGSNLKFL
jgi:hypothetical protein